MEEHLRRFIDSSVKVKLNDESYFTGSLLSIDAYLNVVLQGVLAHDPQLPIPNRRFPSVFIKGSNVECVSLME